MTPERSVYLGQAEELVLREVVLPPAELADYLGRLLAHHLAQLVVGEERQRREGALAAARAGVAERDVEARIDLLVVDVVQHGGDDLLDRHLRQQGAERRRFLDARLDR